MLKDDEDEIEEEERKKRKREEQLEKEREERLKHLSDWKVMHHRLSLVSKLFESIVSFSLWAVFGCNLKVREGRHTWIVTIAMYTGKT